MSNTDTWGGTNELWGYGDTLTFYGFGATETCFINNWEQAIQMVGNSQTLNVWYRWNSDSYKQQRPVIINVWGKEWGKYGESSNETINLYVRAYVYTKSDNIQNLKINIGFSGTQIFLIANGGSTTVANEQTGWQWGAYVALNSCNHQLTLTGNRIGDSIRVYGQNEIITLNNVTNENIYFDNSYRSNHNTTININTSSFKDANNSKSDNIDFTGVTDLTSVNVSSDIGLFIKGATAINNRIVLNTSAYIVLADVGQSVNIQNNSPAAMGPASVHVNSDNSTVNLSGAGSGGNIYFQGSNQRVNVKGSGWNTFFNGDYGNGDVRSWINRSVVFAAPNLKNESVWFSGLNNEVIINGSADEVNISGSYGGSVYMNAPDQTVKISNSWRLPDTIYISASGSNLTLSGEYNSVVLNTANPYITANLKIDCGYTNITMNALGQSIKISGAADYSKEKESYAQTTVFCKASGCIVNMANGKVNLTSGYVRVNDTTYSGTDIEIYVVNGINQSTAPVLNSATNVNITKIPDSFIKYLSTNSVQFSSKGEPYFSGFIQTMSVDQWLNMSLQQMLNLSTAQIQAIPQTVFDNIAKSPNFENSNFKKAFVDYWNKYSLTSIQRTYVQSWIPTNDAALTDVHKIDFDDTTISGLTGDVLEHVVPYLNHKQIMALSETQINGLSPGAISYILYDLGSYASNVVDRTVAKTALLNTTTLINQGVAALASLTPSQIHALTPEQVAAAFKNYTGQSVQKYPELNKSLLSNLSQAAFGEIPVNAIYLMLYYADDNVVGSNGGGDNSPLLLSVDQINTLFAKNQWQTLVNSLTTCGGSTLAYGIKRSTAYLQSNAYAVDVTAKDIAKNLTPEQLQYIPDSIAKLLTREDLYAMSQAQFDSVFTKLTIDQLKALLSYEISQNANNLYDGDIRSATYSSAIDYYSGSFKLNLIEMLNRDAARNSLQNGDSSILFYLNPAKGANAIAQHVLQSNGDTTKNDRLEQDILDFFVNNRFTINNTPNSFKALGHLFQDLNTYKNTANLDKSLEAKVISLTTAASLGYVSAFKSIAVPTSFDAQGLALSSYTFQVIDAINRSKAYMDNLNMLINDVLNECSKLQYKVLDNRASEISAGVNTTSYFQPGAVSNAFVAYYLNGGGLNADKTTAVTAAQSAYNNAGITSIDGVTSPADIGTASIAASSSGNLVYRNDTGLSFFDAMHLIQRDLMVGLKDLLDNTIKGLGFVINETSSARYAAEEARREAIRKQTIDIVCAVFSVVGGMSSIGGGVASVAGVSFGTPKDVLKSYGNIFKLIGTSNTAVSMLVSTAKNLDVSASGHGNIADFYLSSIPIFDSYINTVNLQTNWNGGIRDEISQASAGVKSDLYRLSTILGDNSPGDDGAFVEILTSHTSTWTDFDRQRPMPTLDYISYNDAYGNSHSITINETEIFNPNYNLGGAAAWYFMNDKNCQPSTTGRTGYYQNEWLSSVNAPVVAGYDHTVWALGWDNGVNTNHGGCGYITLRGYK